MKYWGIESTKIVGIQEVPLKYLHSVYIDIEISLFI